MSVEKVKKYFAAFGLAEKVLEFSESSATVELAAKAAGCEPQRIAKTMSFLVGGNPVLILLAGDAKIANPKFKAVFHEKPKMIAADAVENLIGHAVGGVCPFGINDGVTVYLDISLKRFGTVFPAAGSGNSAIELNIPDLEKYSNSAGWIDVGKDWQ